MAIDESRLERIEQRLAYLEAQLGLNAEKPPPMPDVEITPTAGSPANLPDISDFGINFGLKASTSTLMALGAAGSFLLAAAYFVALAYDAGWLTPTRQVVIAFGAGLGFIAGGLWLSQRDRDYAAYLPAVGLAILYFSVYAGQLVYELIPVPVAIALIGGVSVAGLVIGWRFDHSVFSILTAVGVYLTPILIRADFADLLRVVVYFSVWSLMFSFFALQEGRRATYLVALYLAMAAFDITWRLGGSIDWALAAGYQLTQFVIFATTAALFSLRHRTAMSAGSALFHGIPLFYFYGLEYFILKEHAPGLVAPMGLLSVGVVMGLFILVRRRMAEPDMIKSSATLVSLYCAFATSHILFAELLPGEFFIWGALLLPVALMLTQQRLRWGDEIVIPLFIVGGILFFAGFLVALLDLDDLPRVQFPNLALLLYGAALYAVWFYAKQRDSLQQVASVTLYMGHLAILVTTVRTIDSGLALSVSWAFYAVGLITVALLFKLRELGQSSLVIFTASAIKVLIFDLDGSAPGIRIVTLVVLGASLYAGGWLYQNLVRETTRYADDPGLDAAVRMIADLCGRGFDDHRIAAILLRREFAAPPQGAWSAAVVTDLRRTHDIGA